MKKKIFVIFIFGIVILFFVLAILVAILFPKKYKNYVTEQSEKFNLDKALVYAVIKTESDFDKNAVSKSGAIGLMQILPNTAKWIASELDEDYTDEKLFLPEINVKYGCFYLNYLFEKFEDTNIVICAYNAGEGKVLDWIENGKLNEKLIDYSETKNYLKRVKGYYKVYKNKLVNI